MKYISVIFVLYILVSFYFLHFDINFSLVIHYVLVILLVFEKLF